MSQKPTHKAVVIKNVINKGKTDEKTFYTDLGVAWATDTKIGTVINIDFDVFPTKTSQVTLFPIKDKPENKQ